MILYRNCHCIAQVRLVVDYPPNRAGEEVEGDSWAFSTTPLSNCSDTSAALGAHPSKVRERASLKLPIASHMSRLKKQDDVAPIIRLLRILGVCGHSKPAPRPSGNLHKVVPA